MIGYVSSNGDYIKMQVLPYEFDIRKLPAKVRRRWTTSLKHL